MVKSIPRNAGFFLWEYMQIDITDKIDDPVIKKGTICVFIHQYQ